MMPYPPDQATSMTFREYRNLLGKYAKDSTLLDKLLEEKSDLEDFIHNLNTGDDYLQEFFRYVSQASVSELNFDVRQYQRIIDDLPQSIHSDPELNKPLVEWKCYLERTRDELKQAIGEKGGGVSPAQQRAAQIACNVQTYLEAVRLLEEQCEADVKNHPTQEKEIRRRYRKAIEALED
jgi:hypothetical protein